jgi:hypothetical protein
MCGGQRRSNESWKMTLAAEGHNKTAQQKESTHSFSGYVEGVRIEDDGDDEVRTTVPSQIHATATLRTGEPFL